MTSRPAYDEITLALGFHAAVRVRPSLRAASHFAREDGFAYLPHRIAEFHLGTIRDLITVAATDRQEAAAFLDQIGSTPLQIVADAIGAPIITLIAGFIPAANDDLKPGSTGKPMPWPKVYRHLFRVATGVLRWTPEAAWSATPTEINEAYICYDMAHRPADKDADDKQPDAYSADQLRQIEEQGFDPAFDRDGLRALKAKLASAA